ncbi:MAG: protein translocase subunit SecD [Clostridia bacterium]|nr:protein translocase subunit SecD [Clostridia bacterium]
MKRTSKAVFFIVFILIAALVYTSFFGVYKSYGDRKDAVIKSASDIRFGIDIRGGVDATFKPADNVGKITDEQVQSVKDVIELRLVGEGITDYEVYADTANKSVIVRFPWKSDEKSYDPQAALEEIGRTAQLGFYKGDSKDEKTGKPTGEQILSGADVESATVYYNTQDSEYQISLKLKSSGKKAFADATTELAPSQGIISIWLDDDMISSPKVQSAITDGEASIQGGFTLESADNLANLINAGALDFDIVIASYGSVSPTLGHSALDAMVLAAIIVFILVAIYMIIMYRLPGFVACIALAGQAALTIAAISGYFPFINGFTLTLPGIAGIILAFGMGVDANVITAERIKDEVKLGKTIDGSISMGSKSSFSAIFDGNITTMIVAIVLMGVFGPPSSLFSKLLYPFLFMFPTATTGTVYSFGYTLLVGIICNFIFGVWASRKMLQSISRFKCFRKPWFIGGARNND